MAADQSARMGQYVGKTPVANWTDRAGNEVRHDWQIGNRFTALSGQGAHP
jgi:hypothetical protein